ncbi:hypothetical protein [Streptomyces chiangmaiensis]|uniref:Uncharacterized protein n=1 Tax=Streptomyces chiangmaiensis TaxID=766497 RepID=A0ABU7FPQ6_9ACTN|nr:hypothetical protein [Streptomyces chiangmaiensis]MED7825084.1 hypothetical protein [Streptomyces chiangmaiensis]
MVTVAVFFGLLVGAVVTLVRVLLRRGNGPTENADGLLIEEVHRQMAASDRRSFSAVAQHNMTPTMGDSYHNKR